MFKSLQKKYLRKQINKNLASRDLSNLNTSLKTIGFLVDEDVFQDFEKLKSFSEELGLQSKDVVVFTFMNVKKKLPSLRQNMINNKNFTWKGEIKSQNAIEFLEIPFDILVGYYQEENLFMNTMMTLSKSKFKVGFPRVDNRVFDLIIDVDPMKVDSFKRELVKYLRVLGKLN